MKLIFAGTPEFSAHALQAILDAGHQVDLVLTQPDRPSGRGQRLQASPVKALASACGIDVFQPQTLKDEAAQARVRAIEADAMVVAAYGLILPQTVLDMPRFGCINIHASLLPRWRGAAPIQRAILAGDAETGVCIMQMEAGLDTGPVLLRNALPITADDTAATLHDKLAALGASLIVETLEKMPLTSTSQPESGATYAAKIEKSEAPLDWRRSSVELERQVRAFNPFPGALAVYQGSPVKVWQAKAVDAQGAAGLVLSADKHGIVVGCGDGALHLIELQKAGGKRLPVAQFLAGTPMVPGTLFDSVS